MSKKEKKVCVGNDDGFSSTSSSQTVARFKSSYHHQHKGRPAARSATFSDDEDDQPKVTTKVEKPSVTQSKSKVTSKLIKGKTLEQFNQGAEKMLISSTPAAVSKEDTEPEEKTSKLEEEKKQKQDHVKMDGSIIRRAEPRVAQLKEDDETNPNEMKANLIKRMQQTSSLQKCLFSWNGSMVDITSVLNVEDSIFVTENGKKILVSRPVVHTILVGDVDVVVKPVDNSIIRIVKRAMCQVLSSISKPRLVELASIRLS